MNKDPDIARRLAQNAELLASIVETGSFTKAAERLGIAQPAVSQKVKSLEQAIQQPLFTRTTRKLTLTSTGKLVCDAAQESGLLWQQVAERLREASTPNMLRLSLPASLAMKWMIPQLPAFREVGIHLVLEAEDHIIDLNQSGAHVAIRFGTGPYPGYHSDLLCQVALIPVVGITYSGEELSESTARSAAPFLIVDQSGTNDNTGFSWPAYFAAREWPAPDLRSAQFFSRADLALQAAICGIGIALGNTLLVSSDIENGFLREAGDRTPATAKFWLVTTPSFATTAPYIMLRNELTKRMKSEV